MFNTKKKYFAGIGSRRIEEKEKQKLKEISKQLTLKGYIFRSGGALGSDYACEEGYNEAEVILKKKGTFKSFKKKEIYLPWKGYNFSTSNFILDYMPMQIISKANEIASKFHPSFFGLTKGTKKMMARNTFQILGKNLEEKEKTNFVICYTPDGCENSKERTPKTGGTGQAISIASFYDIPILNISKPNSLEFLQKWTNNVYLLQDETFEDLKNINNPLNYEKIDNNNLLKLLNFDISKTSNNINKIIEKILIPEYSKNKEENKILVYSNINKLFDITNIEQNKYFEIIKEEKDKLRTIYSLKNNGKNHIISFKKSELDNLYKISNLNNLFDILENKKPFNEEEFLKEVNILLNNSWIGTNCPPLNRNNYILIRKNIELLNESFMNPLKEYFLNNIYSYQDYLNQLEHFKEYDTKESHNNIKENKKSQTIAKKQ
jgi:hypothetical protein